MHQAIEIDEVRSIEVDGVTFYYDAADECWIDERRVCRACLEEGKVRFADERYSFTCYAGKYCDEHWLTSGFRDACDPSAEFDPLDAGESLEPID